MFSIQVKPLPLKGVDCATPDHLADDVCARCSLSDIEKFPIGTFGGSISIHAIIPGYASFPTFIRTNRYKSLHCPSPLHLELFFLGKMYETIQKELGLEYLFDYIKDNGLPSIQKLWLVQRRPDIIVDTHIKPEYYTLKTTFQLHSGDAT